MLKFCANLNFFYGDLPFLDRFSAAGDDGFKAVEFVSPYDCEPARVRKALDENGLKAVLFNGALGRWDAGERGIVSLAGRDKEFADAVATIITYADALACKRINVMGGIIVDRSEPAATVTDRVVDRLRYAADAFAPKGITLHLEHINSYDMPGYFVSTPAQALDIIERVDRDNAKVQYDIYHAQRSAGELTAFLRRNLARIGHIQIADNPGRNQPGTGEINYSFLFAELERLEYRNWIGLEYKPTPSPAASLAWMTKWVG